MNTKKWSKTGLLWAAVWACSTTLSAQTQPDTWVAQDGLGRSLGSTEQYGEKRDNKTVGLFYVIWHGSHGYDRSTPTLPDEGVMIPTPADSLSPYDNQKLLDANPSNPQYGPVHAFHHWGEPYLGYYVSNDEWVIRKHAQMITDAGVDVIILDVTNAVIYLPTIKTICDTYMKMRAEGSKTPQIAFLFNSSARQTVQRIYDNIYAKGLYKDLWFNWKGKPLLLSPPEGVTPEIADFFTVRHSWFCSAWDWFADGKDKWPWADRYPQKAGWHESPDRPEQVSIAPATHAHEGIGRSFHDGKEPEIHRSGEGLCFSEQAEQALEIDPEFLMITGWNEWSAMRFTDGNSNMMCGKPIKLGDTYFVDDYNHEFSRDIEPLRGDFGDNYYYQMADIIRRFKGVSEQPVYSKLHEISLDDMSTWAKIDAEYTDDRGDVFHRNHHGYGYRLGQLINTTGRNDILSAKVANDGETLYFYVRTAEPISPYSDSLWMRLFLDVKGNDRGTWEGFQYMINNRVENDRETHLEMCLNGWNWKDMGTVAYRVQGDEMVVAVPMASIGIDDPEKFTVDFKWVDNAVKSGDIQECLSDGDAAPNGRFRYRYTFEK